MNQKSAFQENFKDDSDCSDNIPHLSEIVGSNYFF